MPGAERAGGVSTSARTASISPVRAQYAVELKPVFAASSPASPYAVNDA